jgi:hypothetical protein
MIYAVYDTQFDTLDSLKGLKIINHLDAVYDDFDSMLNDWADHIMAGTHVFFVLLDDK